MNSPHLPGTAGVPALWGRHSSRPHLKRRNGLKTLTDPKATHGPAARGFGPTQRVPAARGRWSVTSRLLSVTPESPASAASTSAERRPRHWGHRAEPGPRLEGSCGWRPGCRPSRLTCALRFTQRALSLPSLLSSFLRASSLFEKQ